MRIVIYIILLVSLLCIALYVAKHRTKKYKNSYIKLTSDIEKMIAAMYYEWPDSLLGSRLYQHRELMIVLHKELSLLQKHSCRTLEEECCLYFVVQMISLFEDISSFKYQEDISPLCNEMIYYLHAFYPPHVMQEIHYNTYQKKLSRIKLLQKAATY